MTTKYRTYAVRLDPGVAEYYDKIANGKGVKTSKLIANILTNNYQDLSVNIQLDRIQNIIDSFENKVEEIEIKSSLNEKYFEDFSTTYMMLLWLMMKGEASKDDIRNMQSKGAAYAQKNFKGNDE